MKDQKIDRLLRSAAQVREEEAASMPFGFDTRVIALWRAGLPTANGLVSLVRRVAALSAAVIVIPAIAAVRGVWGETGTLCRSPRPRCKTPSTFLSPGLNAPG